MTDAPERIFVAPAWGYTFTKQSHPVEVEYIRADIHKVVMNHVVYGLWYTNQRYEDELIGLFSTKEIAREKLRMMDEDCRLNTQIRGIELDG